MQKGGECWTQINHWLAAACADRSRRPSVSNYKLLISAITPRFIGFVSTRSKDGTSTNLAPFSYTTVVNHVRYPVMV